MSSSPEVSTLIEIIKALNLGTLIPSAFTLALLWKLYGFFNGLSEKLTRIETKIDGLEKLTPYLIKEQMEHGYKAEDRTKPAKHNPSIEKTDIAEIFGVAFGVSNLLIVFITSLSGSISSFHTILWLLFLVTGILGMLPIIASTKTISRNNRAILSLLSLIPWVYFVLVGYGIITPFL
jgi:hypothetical protein